MFLAWQLGQLNTALLSASLFALRCVHVLSCPAAPLLCRSLSCPVPESCQGRSIPEWGSRIFSPLCVCIRPDRPEELGGFLKYAIALTRAHLMVSCSLHMRWRVTTR